MNILRRATKTLPASATSLLNLNLTATIRRPQEPLREFEQLQAMHIAEREQLLRELSEL